ncbi:3,4-dihydroxy-2-butanone-4-phosphate synthase [Aurantimicrobium sp. MWH-Uga1]|uniref:3,4-dihydroxy-2-butanone-4-phosphate synthase n=1 Tax=Aurantimicrobium sp. MWH-Uga1 TaxID=2079575 RepID=UPI000DEDB1E1|nr:3,4-dihydroxy-2-butanone-4-phosphate synthase [Aurantimicrobium sp. MWH-Uga1]AXE54997.1 Riboflavin biosynthesis protein RibBA [Aurantimicrobium sp. MWH-Uga1]
MALTPIPEVLEALKAGRIVLVADDEGRENEGDAIMAAEFATKESIAWIVKNSSGLICAPMSRDVADRLNLPIMVEHNQDTRKTAYTLTVDAAHGVTTGISASDRALTLNVLANPLSVSHDLIRPGHILPLRAVDGGVLERPGHTEAAVDLLRMAGLSPVGVIAEIVDEDGDMMRMPGLEKLADKENMPLTTVAALINYLEAHPLPARIEGEMDKDRVVFEVETNVPTENGTFRMRGYRDRTTGTDHVAIVAGNPGGEDVLVRVHSECLTGEALHSLKCECGPQLDEALRMIEADPNGGVVLYMRGQEGRGIGLVNKFKAYQLQEQGLDTLDANLALGLPADARDYTAAARMLSDMGIRSVRLLSNNPEKQRQLEKYGIRINGLVPLIVGLGEFNTGYLNVKRDRMGHQLPGILPAIEPAVAAKEVTA